MAEKKKFPSLAEIAAAQPGKTYDFSGMALEDQSKGVGGFAQEAAGKIGEGQMDAGFGLQELIYEAARGGLGYGAEGLEAIGVLDDGTADDFWESSRDTIEKRTDAAKGFRDAVGDINPLYVDNGTAGGDVVREISSVIAPGGWAKAGLRGTRYADDIAEIGRKMTRRQKGAAAIPAAMAADALTHTETKDFEDQKGLGNVMAEVFGVDNPLAIEEDDSPLQKRGVRGLEGGAAATAVGALALALGGSAKGARKLYNGRALNKASAEARQETLNQLAGSARVGDRGADGLRAADQIDPEGAARIRAAEQAAARTSEEPGPMSFRGRDVIRGERQLNEQADDLAGLFARGDDAASTTDDFRAYQEDLDDFAASSARTAQDRAQAEAIASQRARARGFADLIKARNDERELSSFRSAQEASGPAPRAVDDGASRSNTPESRYLDRLRRRDIERELSGVASPSELSGLGKSSPAGGKALYSKSRTADTPQFRNARSLVQAAQERLKSFGIEGVTVKAVRGLVDGVGEASYNGANKLVRASMNTKDIDSAMDAEVVHILRPNLSAEENEILERAAPAWMKRFNIAEDYAEFDEAIQREEAMAAYLRDAIRRGKEPEGALGKIVSKVKRTLTKIGNAFRGMGFQDADEVMNRIRSGEVAQRGPVQTREDIVMYAKADGVSDETAEQVAEGVEKSYLKEDWDTVTRMFDNVIQGVVSFGRILRDAMKNPKNSAARLAAVPEALGKIRSNWLRTTDGSIRAWGKITESQIPSRIADQITRVFWDQKNSIQQRYSNEITDIFRPIAKDQEAKERVYDIVRGARPITDVANQVERKIVEKTKFMTNEYHAEARDAGLQLGHLEDYMPMLTDSEKVLKNPDRFRQLARQVLLRREGVTDEQADKWADAWYDDIWSGANNATFSDKELLELKDLDESLKGFMEKTRTLELEDYDILKEFMVRDPVDLLNRYNAGLSKRIAFQKAFGGGEGYRSIMEQFKQDIKNTKYSAEFGDFSKLVENAMGMERVSLSYGARKGLSWVHTLGSITLMEASLISSLLEPAIAGIRAADAGGAWHGVKVGAQSMGYTIQALAKSGKMEDVKAVAEFIGVASKDLSESAALMRLNPGMESFESNRVAGNFLRLTGQVQFFEATRISQVKVADNYISQLLKQVSQGSNLAKRNLRDLGLTDDEVAKLDRFYKTKGKNDVDKIKLFEEEGEIYSRAVRTFVNDVALQPTNAMRPAWANTPLGRVAWGLTSYLYAFQKNVVFKNVGKAKTALTETTLTREERLQLAAPAVMMTTLLPVMHAGLAELRGKMLNPSDNREQTPSQRTLEAFSRAGLLHPLVDKGVNIVTGARYDQDAATALAGPFASQGLSLVDGFADYATGNNSGNNDERRLAKDLWEGPINTAVNFGLSKMPGGRYIDFGRAAGIVGGFAYKPNRDTFADIVAGPES